MKCWVFVVSPRHSSLKLTETISHNLPPDICLDVNQGLSRYMGAKMYNSAVTQTLIVMKTSCFLYDVYGRCLYLCFEECFEEFSAMVWLFLSRLGIWINRVLCHVIHSICLWKCFGFVFFQEQYWGRIFKGWVSTSFQSYGLLSDVSMGCVNIGSRGEMHWQKEHLSSVFYL
jgi:hypothetical protein